MLSIRMCLHGKWRNLRPSSLPCAWGPRTYQIIFTPMFTLCMDVSRRNNSELMNFTFWFPSLMIAYALGVNNGIPSPRIEYSLVRV